MKLCVILPTKNEAKNIVKVIRDVRTTFNYPILIIDEKSVDRTVELAEKEGATVIQRDGSGYGNGIQKALEIAKAKKYTNIIVVDADNTYSVEDIKKLIGYAKDYDLVIGHRYFKKIRLLHRLPNWLHTSTINFLYGGNLKDVNSGMRIINVDKFYGEITANGMDCNAQQCIIALKRNYKIKEIPVDYFDRFKDKTKGKSKIRKFDGVIILFRIFRELI